MCIRDRACFVLRTACLCYPGVDWIARLHAASRGQDLRSRPLHPRPLFSGTSVGLATQTPSRSPRCWGLTHGRCPCSMSNMSAGSASFGSHAGPPGGLLVASRPLGLRVLRTASLRWASVLWTASLRWASGRFEAAGAFRPADGFAALGFCPLDGSLRWGCPADGSCCAGLLSCGRLLLAALGA